MMVDAPVEISVVVPCYASDKSLPELVERVARVLSDYRFEIVLVDDASPDQTWPTIRELSEKVEQVRGIHLLTNVGQFRALLCGFDHAQGNWVVTLDDDLQHPPEEIPKLIEKLRSHPELDGVIGAYDQKQHSRVRNLGSTLWRKLNQVSLNLPAHLQLSSFRLLRSDVTKAMLEYRTARPILGPLLIRTTTRLANVNVEHSPRKHGRSGYSLWKLIRITVDNIVASSVWPLHLTGLFGMLCSLFSLVLGAVYLLKYLAGMITVSGFTTITLLIIFFGGATLFSIAVLGEYIVRIIQEVSPPPRYVVRSTTFDATTVAGEL